MTAADRLRAMIEALPPQGSITLTRSDLAGLLADEEQGNASVGGAQLPAADLTVAQVAHVFGRGESTVRTWLLEGRFPNAYKLLDREWRIPAGDVDAMQRAEAARYRAEPRRPAAGGRDADTAQWRQHLRPTG